MSSAASLKEEVESVLCRDSWREFYNLGKTAWKVWSPQFLELLVGPAAKKSEVSAGHDLLGRSTMEVLKVKTKN